MLAISVTVPIAVTRVSILMLSWIILSSQCYVLW